MNDKCQHKFPNHCTTINETIFCLYCNGEFRDEDIAEIMKAQHDANVLQMREIVTGKPCYADSFDLKHPNTMIVATNQAELAYIENWCNIHDIPPPWLGKREEFPIALSPNGGGWTDHMDRGLYYVRFRDFINMEPEPPVDPVLQMEAKFQATQSHRSMSTPGGDHRDGKD